MWQIEDTHVDSGNRVYELNGFSGSPVWSLEADEKTIVGLFTSGVGRSIYRGKVHALKMEAIWSRNSSRKCQFMERIIWK